MNRETPVDPIRRTAPGLRPARWLFAAPWRRAAIESLFLLVAMAALTLLAWPDLSSYLAGQGRILSGAGTLLLFALRLRLPAGGWQAQLRSEARSAFFFVAAQALIFVPFDLILRLAPGGPARGALWNVFVIGVASVAFHLILYGFFRAAGRLLEYWNRLRRRRLLWEITHINLVVVIVLSLPLVALLMLRAIGLNNQGLLVPETGALAGFATQLFGNVLPLLAVWVLGLTAAVIVLFPPSVAVSYLAARRTTRRVETLTRATSALREGDLTVRIPVSGEDEVAQLQTNFNAMAANLHRTLRELYAERERVEGLLRARRELVANASHELRTPVATLRGYLDSTLRREESLAPGLRQDLEVMEREAVRMQRLIDDLFALSRAEAGRLTLRVQPTDAGPVIQRAVDSVAGLAWERGRVRVVNRAAASLPPVGADGERLEQVLLNLLHNAIRYTPPGGMVVAGAKVDPDSITLEVRDTGKGIAPEALPHVWERFYRADPARGDEAGSGLGLAIVRELVEAMGGTADVTSAVNEGSTFRVRLKKVTEGESSPAHPGSVTIP